MRPMCFVESPFCFTIMGHKSLSHLLYWCLTIWVTGLLHSPWPGFEPEAAGMVSAAGIAHLPPLSPTTNGVVGDAASAPESSSHRMNGAEPGNDQTCSIKEDSAGVIWLPDFVDTGLSGSALESVLLRSSKGPGSGKPSFTHNSNPGLILDTSSTSTIGCDASGVAFEAEFGKASKRPGSGQPSLHHNSIPDSVAALEEILHTTSSAACFSHLETTFEVDATSEFSIALDDRDLASADQFSVPAATSSGSAAKLDGTHRVDDESPFLKLDSSHLYNMLSRKSNGPGSGTPSKGHNIVRPDQLASE